MTEDESRATSIRKAKKHSTYGLFIEKDGSVTSAMFFLLMSFPLFVMGRWSWAFTSFLAAMLVATCRAMQDLEQEDKETIRYNVIDAQDVLHEMVGYDTMLQDPKCSEEQMEKARLSVRLGLVALPKKFGNDKTLAKLCQEAVYVGLRNFPDDDEIVQVAIALLALIAKDEGVRERHLFEADKFGLDLPIRCMRAALERAQDLDDHRMEQTAAELQRKGCLCLGALSSSNPELAKQIVQEGGLEAILDAISWFRYHSEVANWGLWAIFNICYEDYANKMALVQFNGVAVSIEAMRNCPKSVHVARHATAILFDLMRDDDERPSHGKLDVWKIRSAALDEGLHDGILNAMESFFDQMDIMMMGQEILVGTGFKGNIPQYHPIR